MPASSGDRLSCFQGINSYVNGFGTCLGYGTRVLRLEKEILGGFAKNLLFILGG